ncbi:MAG: hypothetical protein HN368_13240, partial [Spirochaetales bacterium]|nr:hypothetical protein [Spirochaetales bacterium]
PSIMDISLFSRLLIGDNLSFLLSMNQSVVQYTVLPLIALLAQAQSEDDVNEEGDPTSFSYGDALFRALYTPPNHTLSFDVLAYYDRWLFDISFEDFALNSRYGPYYLAAGSKWTFAPSSTVTNSLYAFGSYYRDFGEYDFHFPTTINFTDENEEPDAFYDMHFDWVSSVPSFQVGDELFWNISPTKSLLFGVNGRLADMNGNYTEIITQTDLAGVEFSNETLILPGVDELFYSTYGFAKILGKGENMQYNAGAGLLWYPGADTANPVRPSLTGEVLLLDGKMIAAFGAGWSPGIIDEFSYIDRRLDEQYYELDSVTGLYDPPMAVSAASQIAFLISENRSISASPYFAWYYDLSGFAISTTGSDADGSFISHDPSKGYSAGIDFNWKAELNEKWNLSVSYAYSRTRYLTEEWSWVPPNSEVSHALKSGLLFKSGGFKLGQNLLVYSGIPFTPDIVSEDGLGGYELTQGDYNSAIDYVPTFDVRTNITYSWDFERFDMDFFFNSTNWLAPANGSFAGIDPAKQEIPGTSSAEFANREYLYSLDWTDLLINLLLSNFGLSFSVN